MSTSTTNAAGDLETSDDHCTSIDLGHWRPIKHETRNHSHGNHHDRAGNVRIDWKLPWTSTIHQKSAQTMLTNHEEHPENQRATNAAANDIVCCLTIGLSRWRSQWWWSQQCSPSSSYTSQHHSNQQMKSMSYFLSQPLASHSIYIGEGFKNMTIFWWWQLVFTPH